MCLRRLAMLETVYRLAPDLLRSGRVTLPVGENLSIREARMTDFRLLRHGGFYHAVARYGEDVWTTFTYAGLHVSERVLRRKEQHRFWGVDCYSSGEDRYFRIGNRTFYDDPDQEVEPSAQVVVAVDAWTRELARSTLSGDAPTIFCTPDGNCTPAVELRPSRDLVSDPSGHPSVGRPESAGLWLRPNPDMVAIDGRLAHRLFLAVCQFPAMRASWLQEIIGSNAGEVGRHLRRFVDTGLVAVFDGRHYLSELGIRRAANMSRVLPDIIRRRHAAYLERPYREHELLHQRRGEPAGGQVRPRGSGGRRGLAGRGQPAGPDPGAARPAGAGRRGNPGSRDPLHRVRALLPGAVAGGAQAGSLPPHGGVGPSPAPAGGLRDGAWPVQLPGRRRNLAHVDRHPGAGAGWSGYRAVHSVEPEWSTGGAGL